MMSIRKPELIKKMVKSLKKL